MDTRLAELTDKEKETLRLILRGHDAKSMARSLDLSVHTINDRLRAARRKLSVTSSREAARLLFEQESGDHENHADKDLGEAEQSEPGKVQQIAAGNRISRILAGGFAMMTLFAAGLMLASYMTASDQQSEPVEMPASNAAVISAARDWLALADAGDWQAGFDAAGKPFRDVNTVAGWASAAEQVRTPLGALVSRDVLTVRYLNAPPHGFQEVAFQTQYANSEKVVIETVTLQQEEGVWKVVGILVD